VLVLTALFRALKVSNGTDITRQSDYFADVGDPGVDPVVSESKPIH
jgi:SSS family solute:Na+ symporter